MPKTPPDVDAVAVVPPPPGAAIDTVGLVAPPVPAVVTVIAFTPL
jgi:hypothetical protein